MKRLYLSAAATALVAAGAASAQSTPGNPFYAMDADSNGAVSRAEFSKYMDAEKLASENDAGALFDEIAGDDARLTFAEYTAGEAKIKQATWVETAAAEDAAGEVADADDAPVEATELAAADAADVKEKTSAVNEAVEEPAETADRVAEAASETKDEAASVMDKAKEVAGAAKTAERAADKVADVAKIAAPAAAATTAQTADAADVASAADDAVEKTAANDIDPSADDMKLAEANAEEAARTVELVEEEVEETPGQKLAETQVAAAPSSSEEQATADLNAAQVETVAEQVERNEAILAEAEKAPEARYETAESAEAVAALDQPESTSAEAELDVDRPSSEAVVAEAEEAAAAVAATPVAMSAPQPFAVMDANSDGKVTKREYLNFVRAEAEQRFEAAAGDDRSLSAEEVASELLLNDPIN